MDHIPRHVLTVSWGLYMRAGNKPEKLQSGQIKLGIFSSSCNELLPGQRWECSQQGFNDLL